MNHDTQNSMTLARRRASETSDFYGHVVACSGRWRIIRCRDDIQFIIQSRQAGSAAFPWRAKAYVICDSALPAVLERFSIPSRDLGALTAGLRSRTALTEG